MFTFIIESKKILKKIRKLKKEGRGGNELFNLPTKIRKDDYIDQVIDIDSSRIMTRNRALKFSERLIMNGPKTETKYLSSDQVLSSIKEHND